MTDPTINESKLHEIITLCKNRMDMSYYKYGAARENFGGGRVDAAGCIDQNGVCGGDYRDGENIQ